MYSMNYINTMNYIEGMETKLLCVSTALAFAVYVCQIMFMLDTARHVFRPVGQPKAKLSMFNLREFYLKFLTE